MCLHLRVESVRAEDLCRQLRAGFERTRPSYCRRHPRGGRKGRFRSTTCSLAGFPCQPFSIAGVSKKNALGRPHGFACATQGTLFFDVARIVAARRPRAFLLENVKNLVSHDRGRTFQVIRQTLEEELGYQISFRVLDAAHFLPQHRERILIAGFREATPFSLDDLPLPAAGPKLRSILHPEDGSEDPEEPYTLPPRGQRQSQIHPHRAPLALPAELRRQTSRRRQRLRLWTGGWRLASRAHSPPAITRMARRSWSPAGPRALPDGLTPRECARLMGFPDSFRIPVSDTQAYKQFGNSVAVPVIAAVAAAMRPHLTAVAPVPCIL